MYVQRFKIGLIRIFVVALFVLPSIPLAVAAGEASFFMDNWVNIYLNEDPVTLPKITITSEQDSGITQQHGVAIILPRDVQVLWDKTVEQVSIDGVLRSISYSADQKRVIIPAERDYLSGEKLVIEGLVLRVYDQGTSYQDFYIDTNGDGESDVKGVNGFLIDQETRRTDRTAPFEVDDLAATFADGKVLVSWKNPLDYDLQQIVLTKGESSSTLSRLDTQYEDSAVTLGETVTYKVQTLDYNSNISAGRMVTLLASEEEPAVEEPTVEEPPAEEEPAQEAPPSQDEPLLLRDSVTDADIADVVATTTGIQPDSEHVREVVYLVQKGFITPNYRGSLRLVRHLKYGEFADIIGPALGVEIPGNSLNAYYFAMKKIDGLIDPSVRASDRIRRSDAFLIMLKLAGLEVSEQQLVDDPASLRWYPNRKELAYWLVGILDAKNAKQSE
ncbi:hypothetical protein COV82_00280 [Candidatus Peregrinibacteria bacterium CG11_big_fil_rev_8_21_14_0_20_46_8]|nr:MAG: hypothetical protein COV82_00280 [Candidatus Peregrinibacteria bacterium CG11_big_fil_rev_8_21_14_0_20_46_8]